MVTTTTTADVELQGGEAKPAPAPVGGRRATSWSEKGAKQKAAEGTCLVVFGILSLLCLVMGIAVIAVPAGWTDLWVEAGDTATNVSCPAIVPENRPSSMVPVPVTADREPFITTWDTYVAKVAARPEGVRDGCMPMRFPATSAYRGVAVIYHGFSSCPQEMALLGPALSAEGYDVVMPLLPGHGNALVFSPDAPNFLWCFLGFALSLMALCCCACCRICPCFKDGGPCPCIAAGVCADKGGKCSHSRRTFCVYGCAVLIAIFMFFSLIGWIIVLAGNDDMCLSLSFVDGVGPGCEGMSEYNDNLPSDPAGYTDWLDVFDTSIAALASGELVLAGLSGGGGAALYASQRKRADGAGLYQRVLLIAPYLDVATIGPMLEPAEALGLGGIKLDFGEDCRVVRRNAGKAGYCNYKLNRISAMRGVGKGALETFEAPPGTAWEVVKVENDGVVDNADITLLAEELAAQTASNSSSSSLCVAKHVEAKHSPLSMWNYVMTADASEMEWIPEMTCQFVAFLADGTPIPVDGVTTDGLEEDVCHTDCDDVSNSCSYDCNADAYFTCSAGRRVRRS